MRERSVNAILGGVAFILSDNNLETLEYAGFCADWMQIGRGVDAAQQSSTFSLLFAFYFFMFFVVGNCRRHRLDLVSQCRLHAISFVHTGTVWLMLFVIVRCSLFPVNTGE